MSYGDKLRGGSVRNAGDKVGSKDFGSKVKGTDYSKAVAGGSGRFAKKLASNGRRDDDNVAVNAARGGSRLAGKIVSSADAKKKKPEAKDNKGTEKIQKKGVAKKRKDLKAKGRNDDEVLFPSRQGRAYSDKVFDQSKYNFKRRQKEAWDERLRKEREAQSYFDKLKARTDDGESVFKDEKVTYGKYSRKLKKSKKRKTPYEEYEEKYMKKKKVVISDDETDSEKQERLRKKRQEDQEREKRIQDKEIQKEYERRMNERMMYETRYKQMQNHVKEVQFFGKQAKKRAEKEAKSYLMIIATIGGAFIVIFTLASAAMGMFIGSAGGSGMTSSATSVCWNSSREDIDNAEEYFYQKYLALKAEIQNIIDTETYDELQQNGVLDYDHILFMTFLNAINNGSFTYDSSLESSMDSIFNDIFSYTYRIETETRTRSVYDADTDTWNDEDYDVDVLYIDITVQGFDTYAASNLNSEQLNYYNVAKSIDGGLQCFGAPSESWRNSIIDYYTLSSGSIKTSSVYGETAYAMRDGTVTEVGTNYIKVESADGSSYKISGLASVTQTVGATVTRGQGIGMTGSVMTVSTWIDGEAINPLFYVRMN